MLLIISVTGGSLPETSLAPGVDAPGHEKLHHLFLAVQRGRHQRYYPPGVFAFASAPWSRSAFAMPVFPSLQLCLRRVDDLKNSNQRSPAALPPSSRSDVLEFSPVFQGREPHRAPSGSSR